MNKYIIANDGSVCAVVGGNTYNFGKSHPNYDKLINYLKSNNVEYFEACYDMVSNVNSYCEGYVNLVDGVMHWDGIEMPEMFNSRIVDMIRQGFPFDPMLNFLDNLSDNPSDHAVVELFDFMHNKHMPITYDGCFLAYKAVKGNYTDIYTGTIDNRIGCSPEVDRSKVNSNRKEGCAKGLHVGAIDYAKQYGGINLDDEEGGSGNKLMICKVNPRDVVSVPFDCKYQKLRTCKYEVVAEFDNIFDKVVHLTHDDINQIKKSRTQEQLQEITAKLTRVSDILRKNALKQSACLA